MKTSDFDKKFDAGENVLSNLDLKNARRPNLNAKRVNVDFPTWMVSALDQEAQRIGITRQALIKLWINDRISTDKGQRV